ncbi:hypothetical protein G4177_05610 [Corallococcus sp. ZKHCc1 1396]|uniref:Uncharacterized protein n=1 Tax=Corallococcus soli TaxID=2710757 RepID=A0ABR9PID2_9BACT|nr:hypothetical protein [Corallococcus soli]
MTLAPRWLLLFALAGALPAWAQRVPEQPATTDIRRDGPASTGTEARTSTTDARREEPAPTGQARPAPTDARRQEPVLTDEDREVVDNLELLESLDAAADLEVLLELAEDAP